jgi:glucose-1-phosphate thymidylyltransferase
MTMEIAKAVVLAGDCRGPEPWPSLGSPARQLAPVANKPVLFHHLEALAGAGVRDAAVVTDDVTRTSIRQAVGTGATWGLNVLFVDDDGSADALASPAIADFVGDGPVLVQHGDVLLHERVDTLCRAFADTALDALVLRLAERVDGGAHRPQPQLGYIVGSDVHRVLRREAADDPAAGLDDLLARLGGSGARIGVRDVEACLPCRGRTEALLEANRRLLEELVRDEAGERVFDTEIQGRAAIHPSAEVRDSLIRGPVAIGPGASVANAYIGPYTSIGAHVHIDAVEIEHSIILDGARIRFVGSRIEDSLIGPGAHIERDFRVPQAVRLWVGARADIALS